MVDLPISSSSYLIVLHLNSTVSLMRAASTCTCKRWRRIVADAGFLRHFRSLHAPTVAGDYYNSIMEQTKISFAPSPSTTAAIDSSHVSLDFLQDVDYSQSWSWRVMDSRGSLLLLALDGSLIADGVRSLLICEPLTRRYKWIIPPSAGAGFAAGSEFVRAYLADGAEADDAGGRRVGLSNFRVVYEFCRYPDGPHAAVFTVAGGGGGGHGSSKYSSWEERAIGHVAGTYTHVLGQAGGSWYLYAPGGKLVVLDGSTAEYSSSLLPPAAKEWDMIILLPSMFHVTEGRDGKPRILSVTPDWMLMVFARLDGGRGADEWAIEKRTPCSEAVRGLPGRPLGGQGRRVQLYR